MHTFIFPLAYQQLKMESNENIAMQPVQETNNEITRDKQDAALGQDVEQRAPTLTLTPTSEYPSGIKFSLALTTLCLGIFLITLVRLNRGLVNARMQPLTRSTHS